MTKSLQETDSGSGPWLAYCDWNVTPAQLQASKWLTKLDAHILLPADTAFTRAAGQQRLLDLLMFTVFLLAAGCRHPRAHVQGQRLAHLL